MASMSTREWHVMEVFVNMNAHNFERMKFS